MTSSGTFTGRDRNRAGHRGVRAADAIARVVITCGGIGTILAVLLVGVYLVAVALPLFRPAAARLEARSPWPADDTPMAVGTDPSGAVAWFIAGDGGMLLVGLADGTPIQRLSAEESGLSGATACRVLASGDAAVGFTDGTFRHGTIGVDWQFVEPGRLPPAAAALPRGATAVTDSGPIVRSLDGHHASVRLTSAIGPPSSASDAAIVDIDLTPLDGGWLVAALDAVGRTRLEAASVRRNLLTDETVVTVVSGTIEPPADFPPRFVRVSERGDQAFLFAADGGARRYVVRIVAEPRETERFRVAPAGTGIVAAERLFGGAAVAVADTEGVVRTWFLTRSPEGPAADGFRAGSPAADVSCAGSPAAGDGLRMVAAREFPPPGTDEADRRVTALAAAPRSRMLAVADDAGRVRLLHTTAGSSVLQLDARRPATALAVAAREQRLVAVGSGLLSAWQIAPGHPEIGFTTLVRPTWYETYPAPVHAWETTGHESFEPKYGLWPLIFGTIKATAYAMLFATPIAILAAIYASEFVHPKWRARIKPAIELMAGLPSVVLGFVAGVVIAPWLDSHATAVVAGLFTVPLALLAGAHGWQLLPAGVRLPLASWRFAAVAFGALPGGIAAASMLAPFAERLLFAGDFRGWLDGRGASGFGGWVVALLPLAALAVAALTNRGFGPWLRRAGRDWSDRRMALIALALFVLGAIATVALAGAGGLFLDALRVETRGGLFGTYVQRNALVVGIGMSFAIIPLIFTITDDALTSVPDHLRSASLGAGATPWQTAIRVVVPAAASGIFSAVMIGLGRAVGETMIVLMAAGNTPILDWNVFNGFQTLSAAVATELPEAALGSGHYRVLFLAALALFVMTFVVNTVAELVRQRFRRRAHEL
jgi:phosphate transport system permease protein